MPLCWSSTAICVCSHAGNTSGIGSEQKEVFSMKWNVGSESTDRKDAQTGCLPPDAWTTPRPDDLQCLLRPATNRRSFPVFYSKDWNTVQYSTGNGICEPALIPTLFGKPIPVCNDPDYQSAMTRILLQNRIEHDGTCDSFSLKNSTGIQFIDQ